MREIGAGEQTYRRNRKSLRSLWDHQVDGERGSLAVIVIACKVSKEQELFDFHSQENALDC